MTRLGARSVLVGVLTVVSSILVSRLSVFGTGLLCQYWGCMPSSELRACCAVVQTSKTESRTESRLWSGSVSWAMLCGTRRVGLKRVEKERKFGVGDGAFKAERLR